MALGLIVRTETIGNQDFRGDADDADAKLLTFLLEENLIAMNGLNPEGAGD